MKRFNTNSLLHRPSPTVTY